MKKTLLSTVLCSCLAGHAYALSPAAPETQLIWGGIQQDAEGNGTQEVMLKWREDSNAQGYYLQYFDYHLGIPEKNWNEVDLGNVTSLTANLPIGSAYWVTIQAYNTDGRSPITNVHPVIIKPIVITIPKIVAFSSSDEEREGFLAGLKQFGKQFGNVNLEIIPYDSLDTLATRSTQALADPNVVALVTNGTNSTMRATQSKNTEQPLVVATTASATLFKKQNYVLQIPASNNKQMQSIQKIMQKSVTDNKRMERYVVIMEEHADLAVPSFDLYLSLVKQAFDTESTVPLRNNPDEVFVQLMGTFNFSGNAEEITVIADSLATLKPDVVLYFGSPENFTSLYDTVPGQNWLCSDSAYDLIPKGFKGENVSVVVLGNPGEQSEQATYYSAYDTIGVLGEVVKNIQGPISREKVLATARDINPFAGATGIKSFTETEETGWYDLLTLTSSGWTKIEIK